MQIGLTIPLTEDGSQDIVYLMKEILSLRRVRNKNKMLLTNPVQKLNIDP